MYVGKSFHPRLLLHFAGKNLLRTVIIATLACVLYKVLGWRWMGISFVPVASIGTAVAFYVGFKNNQAYDRLWEARRHWGTITNTGRMFAALLISLVPDKAVQREFIYRHIAWVNILRLQLRKNIPWATSSQNLHQTFLSEENELEKFDDGMRKTFDDMGKPEYYDMMSGKSNAAAHALKKQVHELGRLKKAGVIDEYEHSDLTKLIGVLYDAQGACERIKTTPLFRQYSIFSRVFVLIFIGLLPFGLLNEMDKLGGWGVWLVIPFSMLISWVFYTMEQIGEFSENPFDNSVNDIPISTICRNIEIEMREFVGDTELPKKLDPVDNVLL